MNHFFVEGWGEDEGHCVVLITHDQKCGKTEAEHQGAKITQDYVSRIREVVKVRDGDTYEFRVDPGYRALLLVEIRLMGFDTPERNKGSEREKEKAKEAYELAKTFLWLDRPDMKFWVRSEKDPNGGFGRWLGDVWMERPDGTEIHLGDWLRQHQLASVWPQRWRDEFDS